MCLCNGILEKHSQTVIRVKPMMSSVFIIFQLSIILVFQSTIAVVVILITVFVCLFV